MRLRWMPSGPRSVRDRLDTLALQVAQLPLDVSVQVPSRGHSAKAVIKLPQKSCQTRSNPHHGLGVHAEGLLMAILAKEPIDTPAMMS